MQLRRFTDALEKAARLLEASGAKAPAKDMRAVAGTLRATSDATLEEFVDRTSEAMAREASELSEVTSRGIVESLARLEANPDDQRLETFLATLRKRDVSKDTIAQAASQYSGALPSSFRSKADALRKLESTFRERLRALAKTRHNREISPW